MLREIHHRVRNNLQVVSSLIQIEALQIADPDARRRLGEVSRRIGALGHLHEQLYSAADFSSIDCGDHLNRLCLTLMQSYEYRGIRLITEVAPLRCDLDTAIPLGLITHELLYDTAERLASRRIAMEITVGLGRRGDSVVLAIRGAGPAAAELWGPGHRILHALTGQLEAHIGLDDDGAVVSMAGSRFLG